MITLEVGKRYVRGDGVMETIGGVTKEHADWVWSIGGNWFEQASGRRVGYSSGHYSIPAGYYLVPEGSSANIVKLAERDLDGRMQEINES